MKLVFAFLYVVSLTSALAEHWPLDAIDASLKVHGHVRPAAGAAGQGLVFDGRSVIALKDSGSLNGSDVGLTFSVWFNPYALEGGQRMIVGKNRYSLNERQWGLSIETDGNGGRGGNLNSAEMAIIPITSLKVK